MLAAVVFRLLLMFFTSSRISMESSSHSSSSDTSPSKLPPLEASKDPRLSCLKLRKGVTNNNIGTQSDLTRPKIQSTTRTTEFFVVGKMSGILVGFLILVGHLLERPQRNVQYG